MGDDVPPNQSSTCFPLPPPLSPTTSTLEYKVDFFVAHGLGCVSQHTFISHLAIKLFFGGGGDVRNELNFMPKGGGSSGFVQP